MEWMFNVKEYITICKVLQRHCFPVKITKISFSYF